MEISRHGNYLVSHCPFCGALLYVPWVGRDSSWNLQDVAKNHRAENPDCAAQYKTLPTMEEIREMWQEANREEIENNLKSWRDSWE